MDLLTSPDETVILSGFLNRLHLGKVGLSVQNVSLVLVLRTK